MFRVFKGTVKILTDPGLVKNTCSFVGMDSGGMLINEGQIFINQTSICD